MDEAEEQIGKGENGLVGTDWWSAWRQCTGEHEGAGAVLAGGWTRGGERLERCRPKNGGKGMAPCQRETTGEAVGSHARMREQAPPWEGGGAEHIFHLVSARHAGRQPERANARSRLPPACLAEKDGRSGG